MPIDELLTCFDEIGNVIEPKLRSEVHTQPYRIWHGVSCIWIVNNKGQILCSRRSSHVTQNANKWQTYFGGHLKAGADFIDTAIIELNEEVGLNIKKSSLHLFKIGKDFKNKQFFHNFLFKYNEPLEDLDFKDGEVEEVKWYDFADYQQAQETSPELWCNGTSQEQYEEIKSLLENS